MTDSERTSPPEPPTASSEFSIEGFVPRTTLHVLGIYPGDPTHRWRPSGFSKAIRTPEGHASVRLDWDDAGRVSASGWGPGADWAVGQAPSWLGTDDDLTGFDPTVDRRVDRLWRTHGPFRLGTFGAVWQELLLVILGQRVTSQDALRSWSELCRRWGHAAPGPDGLRLPPEPEELRRLSLADLHRIGVERRRAEALVLAARRADRLEEAASMAPGDAVQRLSALPGLGRWTATATATVTHAGPDIVILGDYGMPTLVNFFFTGDASMLPPEPHGDRIMLEHLSPWTGHEQRVMRLLLASDVRVPRRAPRAKNPDIRRM